MLDERASKRLCDLRSEVQTMERLCSTQLDELRTLQESTTTADKDLQELQNTLDIFRSKEINTQNLIVDLDSGGKTVYAKVQQAKTLLDALQINVSNLPKAGHLERLKTIYDETIKFFLQSEIQLDKVEQRIETLHLQKQELDKPLAVTEPLIGSNSRPAPNSFDDIVVRLRALEDKFPWSLFQDDKDAMPVEVFLGLVSNLQKDVRSLQSDLRKTTNIVEHLEQCQRELQELRKQVGTSPCSYFLSLLQSHNALVPEPATMAYTTKSFENFMKQEFCLLSECCLAVYVFYNKLCHLCRKYNIMLKELTTSTHDSEIHECGPMSNNTVLRQMSADLFHKLESPSFLPRENKRMEFLLYSYGQSYNWFQLIQQ